MNSYWGSVPSFPTSHPSISSISPSVSTFQAKHRCFSWLEQTPARSVCRGWGASHRSVDAISVASAWVLFRQLSPSLRRGPTSTALFPLISACSATSGLACALSTTSGQAQLSRDRVSVCVWMIQTGGQSEFSPAAVYHYKAITLRENLINRTCNAVTPSRQRGEAGGGKFLALISAGTSGPVLNQAAHMSVAPVGYSHRDLRQLWVFGSERLTQSQHGRCGTSRVKVSPLYQYFV